MKKLSLSKQSYSESVVRKTLYWMSEICDWKLEEDGESWNIFFTKKIGNKRECELDFNKLLNDFLLREKLDKNTKYYREKIILSALLKISETNEND